MTKTLAPTFFKITILYLMALTAIAVQSLPSSGADAVVASWYGQSYRGKPTASGERFDPADHTCAHSTLPFGTLIEVSRSDRPNRVVVRVNDRGPISGGRGIDLSEAAARPLGLIAAGVAEVMVEVIGWVD
jgi:rare lipoprotein A